MSRARFAVSTILDGLSGVLNIALFVTFSPLLTWYYRRWGATPEEASRALPGDEVVRHPQSMVTCVVSVKGAPEAVWPWLVQLGCKRGGWYSYDLLDNGGEASADRILPEFQQLAIGDTIYATPDGRVGYPVADLQTNKLLLMGGTLDTRTGKPADPNDPNLTAYFSGSNAVYLEAVGTEETRLFFRMRVGWNPSWVNTLAYRVFLEPISFVMARRMLKGIKARVEGRV